MQRLASAGWAVVLWERLASRDQIHASICAFIHVALSTSSVAGDLKRRDLKRRDLKRRDLNVNYAVG
jgi:hypothetical protein